MTTAQTQEATDSPTTTNETPSTTTTTTPKPTTTTTAPVTAQAVCDDKGMVGLFADPNDTTCKE